MDAMLLRALSKLPKLVELLHLAVFGADIVPPLTKSRYPPLTDLVIDDGDLYGVGTLFKNT
ncbi:hypothetical protein JAAARDRAFT_200218 [Jaapia argillacea MUCL 33604]|uniref:Uncharacterized protein n=1 Tax=Jaapia argillacea MUCL 33604 TaxID=933084 RepID=A0A067PI17_9AGAM|nr:hypothetical protein JAAARDRAFT_200218 [Jaapia argillacea MUCL 33604]